MVNSYSIPLYPTAKLGMILQSHAKETKQGTATFTLKLLLEKYKTEYIKMWGEEDYKEYHNNLSMSYDEQQKLKMKKEEEQIKKAEEKLRLKKKSLRLKEKELKIREGNASIRNGAIQEKIAELKLKKSRWEKILENATEKRFQINAQNKLDEINAQIQALG